MLFMFLKQLLVEREVVFLKEVIHKMILYYHFNQVQLVFILDKLMLVEILQIMNKKKMIRVNHLFLLNILYFF